MNLTTNQYWCITAGYVCDFDKLFSDANLNHLCPGGSGYIGYRSCAEEGKIEDDSGIAHSALTSNKYITGMHTASGLEEEHPEPDVSEFEDPQDTLDPGSGGHDNATMEETLNPKIEKNATHYIIFEGRQLFKPKLISQRYFVSKTGTTIAVQILDLAPTPSADKPLMWIWTQKYRMLFFQLGPDVIYKKDSDNQQWSLKDTELKEIMDCAWEALSPDSNEILNNLEALPLMNGTGYGKRHSLLTFHWINLAKKDGKDEIKCFMCAGKTQLRNMQKHVGKHILVALQRFKIDW
ncbi:hypothetical protein B0H34DRAFT_674967 [Crassisporium funariophilum]|nr:hypothetical protein B0H34DRAFT_674967 [Crassisporium funariophilum]